MLDTLYIKDVTQADALLKPKRVEIMRQLAEPRTCTEIGGVLGQTPQAIYYHVKQLQGAGLVSLVDERRVRGIVEGIYQAAARSFWVAPAAVGRLGSPRAREEMLGLGYLLNLTEEMAADLAGLASRPVSLPSFGIAGDIRLAPEDGAAFVAELQRAFGDVLSRYGSSETGHTFRLALACYPHTPPAPPAASTPAATAAGQPAGGQPAGAQPAGGQPTGGQPAAPGPDPAGGHAAPAAPGTPPAPGTPADPGGTGTA